MYIGIKWPWSKIKILPILQSSNASPRWRVCLKTASRITYSVRFCGRCVDVVQVIPMKYFSTRGGGDLLTFEEVNRFIPIRFSRHVLKAFLLCRPACRSLVGRPQWSRTQWRLVRRYPHLARKLDHLLLCRSFRRRALPLHLSGRALTRRVTRAREPIVHHHVPTPRHHALGETERNRVHLRAVPRSYFLVQGRGIAAPRQSLRVFPREEKRA